MLSAAAFVDLCESELNLCAVRPGETLVVLSQGDQRLDYAEAFLGAAARLGAVALHLRLPHAGGGIGGDVGVWEVGATPLASNQAAVELLKQADIVIDLMFLLHSKELFAIQLSGTRILTCIEPIDVLVRLFPRPELTQRVNRAVELLSSTEILRFTSPAGTDVTYNVGVYPTIGQFGYADKAGQWDHWTSSGMVYTYGADDGVNGRVVIAPGDVILPFKSYVSSPIEFRIESGRIRGIHGGFEAEIMREYMANFDDERAYGVSHIGWGFNESAKWTALATDRRGHGMELRAFSGGVLFSTGPNTQVGGPNNTQCHLDIPMRHCSLFLDDRPIITDGQLNASVT